MTESFLFDTVASSAVGFVLILLGLGATLQFRPANKYIQAALLGIAILGTLFWGFGICLLKSAILLRTGMYLAIAVCAYLAGKLLLLSGESRKMNVLICCLCFLIGWFIAELVWIPRMIRVPYLRERYENRHTSQSEMGPKIETTHFLVTKVAFRSAKEAQPQNSHVNPLTGHLSTSQINAGCRPDIVAKNPS